MINVNTDKYKNVLELLEDEHLMDLEFYVRENKQLKELISFMQIEIDRDEKTGKITIIYFY
ncbi:hypothetical protein [Clostridium butyricum]